MKYLAVFVLPLILAGCATTQTKSGQLYDIRNVNEVRQFIASGGDVNQIDRSGRTPLHVAASMSPDAVPILLNAGAKVNLQDKDGLTPLHYAARHNSSVIRLLLLSGADVSLASEGSIRCDRQRFKKIEDANAYEMSLACGFKQSAKIFADFAEESDAWQLAERVNTFQSYEVYLKRYPTGMFETEAESRYEQLKNTFISDIQEAQPCLLKEEGWFYVSGQCQNGLAHSQGEAITIDGKRFKGEFFKGWRKNGQLIENDDVTFDGPFLLGQANGDGVCLFEGSYEECKMYKGERIGAWYKQRLALKSEIQNLRQEIVSLKHAVNNQSRVSTTSRSSGSDYSYIADLNSKDKTKRTVSRIKAAVDLIGFFAKAASKD